MPSIIHLQPFNGVHEFTPFCYLLEIDGFGILLDCGWDEQFNEQYIEELSKYVYDIRIVFRHTDNYPSDRALSIWAIPEYYHVSTVYS